MAGGNISSEKIDLLIYGPSRPILENGFSDQFVLHAFETKHDLERLTPAVAENVTLLVRTPPRGSSSFLSRDVSAPTDVPE